MSLPCDIILRVDRVGEKIFDLYRCRSNCGQAGLTSTNRESSNVVVCVGSRRLDIIYKQESRSYTVLVDYQNQESVVNTSDYEEPESHTSISSAVVCVAVDIQIHDPRVAALAQSFGSNQLSIEYGSSIPLPHCSHISWRRGEGVVWCQSHVSFVHAELPCTGAHSTRSGHQNAY